MCSNMHPPFAIVTAESLFRGLAIDATDCA